jgi:hypothetical protein
MYNGPVIGQIQQKSTKEEERRYAIPMVMD